MAKNNYFEPNTITLARWVDKAFEHSLKKENITLGFKICKIWPLNFIAIARMFGPNELLTTLKKKDYEN